MRCDTQKISAYYDGQLREIEQRLVAEHLLKCDQCSAVLASYRSIALGLRQLPAGRVPRSLDSALRARLGEVKGRHWSRFATHWLANLGGMAAVVVLALGVAAVMVYNNGVVVDSVQAYSPVDATVDVPVDTAIPIVFSKPVDRGAIQEHTRIEPPAELTYEWHDLELIVRPKTELRAGTEYRVIVAPVAEGDHNRPSRSVITFKTVSPVAVARAVNDAVPLKDSGGVSRQKLGAGDEPEAGTVPRDGGSASKPEDGPARARVDIKPAVGGDGSNRSDDRQGRAVAATSAVTAKGSGGVADNAVSGRSESVLPDANARASQVAGNGGGPNGSKQEPSGPATRRASSALDADVASRSGPSAVSEPRQLAPDLLAPTRIPDKADGSCAGFPSGRFAHLYDKRVLRERLGCLAGNELSAYLTEQSEGGHAVQRDDLKLSYLLRNDGTWTRDTSGRAAAVGAEDDIRDNSRISQAARRARAATILDFQHGSLIVGPSGDSYAVFGNGTWLELSAADKD